MDVHAQILAEIQRKPGQKARTIAHALGIEPKDVNSVLYGYLRSQVYQDGQYGWHPQSERERKDPIDTKPEHEKGPLDNLARYYLAAMGYDDNSVSTFATSNNGKPDYVEVSKIPDDDEATCLDEDDAKALFRNVAGQRKPMSLFFGYPTFLRRHRAKKSGWEGFFVEPLFVFPILVDEHGRRHGQIDFSFPMINQSVIRSIMGLKEEVMHEMVQLEEELGLTDTSNAPTLDEVALRLGGIRPNWPWIERINPYELGQGMVLSKCDRPGFYNRAIIIAAEKSPYTIGLESELRDLGRAQLNGQSVLGDLLSPSAPLNQSPPDAPQRLIEVLPMNSEQRAAIERALSSKLTIVTGPPGTGKSQVVTNLLLNCAWRGKRVLFASKNNKAVDVVETRVNNLGPNPILLRVGSQSYQTRLADFLVQLLSVQATPSDRSRYQESLDQYQKLAVRLDMVFSSMMETVRMRNELDQSDQRAQEARKHIPENAWTLITEDAIARMEEALPAYVAAANRADRKKQGVLTRVLWPFIGGGRLEALQTAWAGIEQWIHKMGLATADLCSKGQSVDRASDVAVTLKNTALHARNIALYRKAYAFLQGAPPLEDLAAYDFQLNKDLSMAASRLWEQWVRLMPDRLNYGDRAKIGRYQATLKAVVQAGSEQRLPSTIWQQYRDILRETSGLFPCWAVTSLSAKGKIPFTEGFYDLVVIDEASQCDIASALPLLYRAKAAVIIGDSKQLSHISALGVIQDQQLLRKHGLEGTMQEWAYATNSLFELALGKVEQGGVIDLRDHHRSHADIINFSNNTFYGGRLRVATKYDRLKSPNRQVAGIRWVNCAGHATAPGGSGSLNDLEARQLVATLRDLLINKGYRGTVGVVSPFRAQVNRIQELIAADTALAPSLSAAELLVDTVHKFQGDERDVMFFSPVMANGIGRGPIGFLKNNGNLFNVAITRARAMLIVVGDKGYINQCDVSYMRDFSRYVDNLSNTTGSANDASTPSDSGPEYPTVSNPEWVSEWERLLYKALYQEGIRTIPQYAIEQYRLDLALIHGDRRLDIEVDGERYHRNWDGELCRRDQIRNQRMFELGWDVVRFWVYEIRDDLPRCIDRVKAWLARDGRARKE